MSRVLIADDHRLLRHALRRALQNAGVASVSEAADGEEAVRLAAAQRPDVVVMDVTMPVLDGVEAARRIHQIAPDVRILVLTMHDEDALRAEAIRAGASGFLTKDSALQEVVDAVRALAEGTRAIHHERPPPLTTREREILQLVADGHSTTEIAQSLFISAKTVKNHLASIYAKLEARDRTEAVVSGVRRGIVQLT